MFITSNIRDDKRLLNTSVVTVFACEIDSDLSTEKYALTEQELIKIIPLYF